MRIFPPGSFWATRRGVYYTDHEQACHVHQKICLAIKGRSWPCNKVSQFGCMIRESSAPGWQRKVRILIAIQPLSNWSNVCVFEERTNAHGSILSNVPVITFIFSRVKKKDRQRKIKLKQTRGEIVAKMERENR